VAPQAVKEEDFMSRRSNPTARQGRLGAELRKMRERAGVTAREAGGVIGVDQATMSHVEAGRVAVDEERVRRLASHYGVHDSELVDALAEMTRKGKRGWWEAYRGVIPSVLLDLAELEHHACRIRSFQVIHIPGLLQTEAHVRALFRRTMPELTSEELDAIVAFRVGRRRVLDCEHAPTLDVVVHEAALRIRAADRKEARNQLAFIAEMADRPEVTVRVIPFDRDGFNKASFAMQYLVGPVRQLDTAQFDGVHRSHFVDDEAQLADFRSVLEAVTDASLSPADSLDLIGRIAREL
jgi:transcriptional regulator with XRE-family HTH domain